MRVNKLDDPGLPHWHKRALIAAAVVGSGVLLQDTCGAQNAIFDALVGSGVKISPYDTLQLPKPVLTDGLAQDRQRQTIEALVAGRYDWETFTRKSVVSPLLLKISENAAAAGPVVRKVDLYFVAFGSLDVLRTDDYLHKHLSLSATTDDGQTAGQAKLLSTDDARKRGLVKGDDKAGPRWVSVNSTLLGKVRIRLTTQNLKTQTKDSTLIASVADPRFERDAEYPNSWQSLSVDDAGKRQVGPAQPYVGMGSYVKSTRLAEPAGAMFVEYHVAFVEPKEWFHGTNLLRSKLPIVAQQMVRTFRRSLGE